MTETTKYLRHSLPGLVAILMYLIFWLSSDYQKTMTFIEKFKDAGFWSGVITALASLALGFLFAQIYHSFYWSRLMRRWPSMDNYDLLTKLMKENLIIINQNGKKIQVSDFKCNNINDRRRTWTIANYLFRFHCPEQQKKMEGWIDRLVNYTHSAGTIISSILIAFAVWLILHIISWIVKGESMLNYKTLIVIAEFVLVSYALYNLYKKNQMALEETSNATLLASIKQISDRDKPITVYYYSLAVGQEPSGP